MLLMVLVGAIVSSLNTVRSDFRSFIGTHEIENTCELIKSGIEKLYTGERYNSSVNITSRVFVSLPERIGDMNYRARFVNDSAIIEAFGPPSINDTCRIGFNITYRGSTSGGRTEINYTRFSEGIDLIFMGRA
ncbi:MAG: hypothetical protein HYY37_03255 [Candidatus Aenigmarchaeota archaeon]|nr:hypothetical protein [Candidatus Aenigmarchaeota archaeon]